MSIFYSTKYKSTIVRSFCLLLLIVTPIIGNAQQPILSEIYHRLEVSDSKLIIEYKADKKIDSISAKLDSLIGSTGNPKENLNFQFLTDKTAFVYGNEQGYGIWPFLYKTTDGGISWQKLLFEKREYGATINKDNFFMFDDKRGILVYNTDGFPWRKKKKRKPQFKYYITTNGGKSWKKKSKTLKHAHGLRIQNIAYEMQCRYTPDGTVEIKLMKAPWEAVSGKRSVDDRTRVILTSNDFGKSFDEKAVK